MEKIIEQLAARDSEWLNTTEVLKYLPMSRQNLQVLMDDGDLPYYQPMPRGSRYVLRDDLIEHLRKNYVARA